MHSVHQGSITEVLLMTIRSTAGRALIALVVLLFAATAVFAVDPSGSPSASATASAAASASAEPSGSAGASPSLSASPSASVSPATAPVATGAPKASEKPEGSEAPEAAEKSDEDGNAPPSADQIARIVGKLKDVGITATAAQLQDLASMVGMGGAVRVFAFAQASGKTPAQILAMHEAGKGWGQIKHELNLSIGPGIGWIMGNGHGHGNGKGPKN
jgi:hypothetical protein